MSTYFGLELSTYGGKPIELYRFTHGSQVWTYCRSSANVSYNGETYTSAPISRSAIGQENEISKDTITISFDLANAVTQLFLTGNPEKIVTLTIFRLHSGAEGVVCIWKGRITLAKWTENHCDLSGESIFSKQKQGGRGPRYTKQCRADLYGAQCGVNKASYAVAATVVTVDSGLTVITAAEAASYVDGYFVGGMFKTASGNYRTIIHHAGDSITIWSPIASLAEGDSITLYAGCDRSIEVCESRFGNSVNFRGFPWIPTDNPFVGSVV